MLFVVPAEPITPELKGLSPRGQESPCVLCEPRPGPGLCASASRASHWPASCPGLAEVTGAFPPRFWASLQAEGCFCCVRRPRPFTENRLSPSTLSTGSSCWYLWQYSLAKPSGLGVQSFLSSGSASRRGGCPRPLTRVCVQGLHKGCVSTHASTLAWVLLLMAQQSVEEGAGRPPEKKYELAQNI